MYLIYKILNDRVPPTLSGVRSDVTILKPTISNVLKFAQSYHPFIAWWFFHHSGVFYNKYFVMVVLLDKNQIVHRTCVFPGFYKFPFMDKEDLQLGEIWTREDYRNKGIATNVIKYILNLDQYKNKTFWYVVEESSSESVSLAESSGFYACYTAHKKNKMGMSFIGKYEISTKPEFKS